MGAKTLLSVEQLELLPEIEDISYELDQGELVEMSGASLLHNLIRDQLTRRLGNHLEAHTTSGKVVSEQWFRLSKDTVFAPDVAFIGPAKLSAVELDQRIQPFGPDLVAEVTSPSNTFDEVARRVRQYLQAGAKTVWIFVTPLREVHIYAAGAHPMILTEDDLLQETELLPGFSVQVADLFRKLSFPLVRHFF